MTIGIAARGPNAGLAVFEALAAAERAATGSIGGFVAFAAITRDGRVLRAETQRGGTRTLFLEGERTGVPPPPEVAEAPVAGLMSSGPDRAAPLAQFVTADGSGLLVTGHRMPNNLGRGGLPLNVETLDLLRSGLDAGAALERVLSENPDADVGMIAVDRRGAVHARNAARVAARPDLGHARRESARGEAAVEVLHNAIGPGPAVAALAAETALETMAPAGRPDGWLEVHAGAPLEAGRENAVFVDESLAVVRIMTVDPRLVRGRQNGAAIYIDAAVRCGDRMLGRTLAEPYAVVEDGRIVSLSGQPRFRLGFRRARNPE